LSDFFYVWLKRSLDEIWPDLFRRLSTPKAEELVADLKRHSGRDSAENFFMKGMEHALSNLERLASDYTPLTIFYAFKQSAIAEDGITSAGWASFLQSIVSSGFAVDGT
jgi:putative DNA methylase